jgi:hypothetical protein
MDVNSEIKRAINKGRLFPSRRGKDGTNGSTDGFLLASYMYGPSY